MVDLVRHYLAKRRALGFALRTQGPQLLQFARYADCCGHRGPLTVQLAVRWARLPKRRLLVIAGRFDDVPRRFPQFTAWRRAWAHVVECRATDVEASQIPSLLLAGPHSLQLADRLHWRGHWLGDDSEISAWHEVVDALVQRSEVDFPANTLGL